MKDIDQKLYESIKLGNLELVENALREGADLNCICDTRKWDYPNSKEFASFVGWYPIHVAAVFGTPEIIEALCNAGASLKQKKDAKNLQPLHVAAWFGKTENLEKLILLGKKKYADQDKFVQFINEKNTWGGTALHEAGKFGRVKIAAILSENFADHRAEDNNGNTACDIANYYQKWRAAEVIDSYRYKGGRNKIKSVEINASDDENNQPNEALVLYQFSNKNINLKNRFGWTVLHQAARDGDLDSINHFLSLGADINSYSTGHESPAPTPLHVAIRSGKFKAALLLIDNKARRDIQCIAHDSTLETPLELAQSFLQHPDSTKESDKIDLLKVIRLLKGEKLPKNHTDYSTTNKTLAAPVEKLIGVDKQTEEITSFLNTIKANPNANQHFLLLSGPSGTGKTKLAKRLAPELGFVCKELERGNENDQWLSQLKNRTQDFFKKAKSENQWICLFIDEIDAICPEVEGVVQNGYHDYNDINTAIQMEITQLEGSKVVLIGATNYLQKIQPAIRNRAGIPILFKLPDLKTREMIIKYQLDKISFECYLALEDETICNRLAQATTGWSHRLLKDYLDNVKSKAERENKKGRSGYKIFNNDFIEIFKDSQKTFMDDHKKSCPNINIVPPNLSLHNQEDIFSDMVGLTDDDKISLQGICEFVKDPAFYRQMGVEVNRNTIFWGPTGTGKTERAKLIASNTNALFINIDGGKYKFSDTLAELKKVFAIAKNFEKAIIFIDEMDAITHDHADAKDFLQTELDGFVSSKENVLVVIGATNYPNNIARAIKSRFPIILKVALPNKDERMELFKLYLNKIQHIDRGGLLKEYFEKACGLLVEASDGLAQRDIKHLINNAVTKIIDIEKIKKTKITLTVELIIKEVGQKRDELKLPKIQLSHFYVNDESDASVGASSSSSGIHNQWQGTKPINSTPLGTNIKPGDDEKKSENYIKKL